MYHFSKSVSVKLDCRIVIDVYCGVINHLTTCYGGTTRLPLEHFLSVSATDSFALYIFVLLFSSFPPEVISQGKVVSQIKDSWFYICLSLAVYFLYKTFVLLAVDKPVILKLT
jgi:hypothetical protein